MLLHLQRLDPVKVRQSRKQIIVFWETFFCEIRAPQTHIFKIAQLDLTALVVVIGKPLHRWKLGHSVLKWVFIGHFLTLTLLQITDKDQSLSVPNNWLLQKVKIAGTSNLTRNFCFSKYDHIKSISTHSGRTAPSQKYWCGLM